MSVRAPYLGWLVAWCTACGAPASTTTTPPAPIAEPTPPTTTAAVDDQAADREFQALAIDLAIRTRRVIVGWGTVAFDGAAGRYATLRRIEDESEAPGAYLIDVGGQRWLATFEDDGRTEPWGADEATETAARANPSKPEAWAWTRRPERALLHRQTHRGGYEQAEFAVVGGKLVVLAQESLNDARDDETPSTTTHTCPACPPLIGDDQSSFMKAVRGPAKTLDELVD